jgi:cellulose synthase/poly-beta-1,6-N-acetylglucosamine synthase-like glycosyltransferase
MTGRWDPQVLYEDLVRRLAEPIVNAPAQIDAALSQFTLGLRTLVFLTMVVLALWTRCSPTRRILVLAQAFGYVAVMVLVDAVLLVVQVVFSVSIGPASFFGNFVALFLGFLALARMLFASFALPRPTTLPFVPRPRFNDAATLVACTVAAMAISMVGILVIYRAADPSWHAALGVLLPLPFAESALFIRTGLLALVNLATVQPDPPVGDFRPAIDVIIPAYNEEEVIVETLKAIDAAAGRYGGPVQVYLVNDGSTDRTADLAASVFAGYRSASGTLIEGRHGGKSEALNMALRQTTSDIVVRIDADTIVGEWSLYYVPRWFRDYPDIGMVEAMMFPRWRGSRFANMRLFEELRQFGMVHATVQSTDAVNVVPGVFTAFRRQVAVDMGGFTVGMNGEDGDFTLRFGRMGYRTWMDPEVIVYEDVPTSYGEIREQRIRWSRAVVHNQSRNGPYRAGLASPRSWYSQTHQFFKNVFCPARAMIPVYLVLLAVFAGGSYLGLVALIAAGYVVGEILFMASAFVLCLGYRQHRHLGWVLLWPFWQELLVWWPTEAWLSLPGRPAGFSGARPTRVTEAVVH